MAQRGCFRCGKCCQTFGIAVSEAHDADTRRFHELHGVVYQTDGGHLMIVARCEALHVTSEGCAGCGIYAERPQLCRDYLCDAAREEVPDSA